MILNQRRVLKFITSGIMFTTFLIISHNFKIINQENKL
jgi:hypothetical protein